MYRVLNPIRVRPTVSAEELNSTMHAWLELVLALQRALSAEVQVQSSLVELCRSRRAFHRLQASCWRATPSTRVPAVQQRLSSHSELSADWSTVRWLSTCSQSIDWSTARWLSARSQSAEWSTEEPRLTASVQTTVLHRAVLSDVDFVGRSLTIVEELRTIFFVNHFP